MASYLTVFSIGVRFPWKFTMRKSMGVYDASLRCTENRYALIPKFPRILIGSIMYAASLHEGTDGL